MGLCVLGGFKENLVPGTLPFFLWGIANAAHEVFRKLFGDVPELTSGWVYLFYKPETTKTILQLSQSVVKYFQNVVI